MIVGIVCWAVLIIVAFLVWNELWDDYIPHNHARKESQTSTFIGDLTADDGPESGLGDRGAWKKDEATYTPPDNVTSTWKG